MHSFGSTLTSRQSSSGSVLPLTAEPTPGQGCQFDGHWPPVSPRVSAATTRAQQNFVIEVQTPAGVEHVWTGDRWMQAPDGLKAHEPQFWAPLSFGEDGAIGPVRWVDNFTLDVSVGVSV